MDHISYYSCGESDSGVEFAGESDTPTSVCDDSSGGNPGNTVSGNCKTVIAGDSDVEGINVSYRAFTPAHDDGKPRPQMTAMPILDCTPSDDPESSTTATTTTDEVASSTQPRECQTRSLTQLFHLTATLNEHFRLSITRMEKKLDEVVRKVSEMEEAMQEWKEGHKNSEKGEEEDEKNEEEKEVVEEEKESLSEDEGHRVHSWEKWLPRTRQMKDCIDQNKAGNDTKRNKEVNETKTENEENNTEFAQSIYDTPAPASTENSVGDNLESDQGAQSKSVKDTFLLNESEKKEIKHLHDVTTHTHGVAMTTAKEVQQQPPRPIETYHITPNHAGLAICKGTRNSKTDLLCVRSSLPKIPANSSGITMIETREWMFRVACHTNPGEHVYVVGNCEALGCWKPAQVIPLFLETNKDGGSSEEGIWSRTINIPLNKIDYRYCVCVTVENDAEETQPKVYAIKSWETNLQPRQIPENDSNVQDPSVEKFGCYGGYERVDQGWLVKDSVVHIKLCSSNLYNNPIMLWKKKYIGKKYRVKVIPIDISKTNSYEPLMNGGLEESTEFDISDVRHQAKSSWPIMEAAVMKEGLCHFQYQEQFGIPYNEEDFLVFQCRMIHPDSIAYLVDIYVEEDGKEIPKYIGCSFILPSNLRENFGVTTLPITSQKHLPIGQLTAHYMVVNPMNPCICDMSISYARHWKDSWKGLEVGHRGAGNSYHSQPTSCANIRENTVASLKYAAENGADMVEFDVQLSKDHIPVIYHDFHACIALKRKKEQEQTDLLEIPIKDLTLEQLQALKDLSHLQEGQPCDILSYCDQEDMVYHKKEKGLNRFRDEEFEDHQPFPTLQRALETVPVSCGFNVEVKWTMQMKDGTYELQHPFELNYFLDLILKVVLEHSGKRKIVFSCFHPDICTMLRLKQNRYPVLFLTQGVSENWPPYEDQRTSSIKHAVLYATCADILGINVNTEDLLRDPSQMKLALEHNMIVFCWGDENNDVDNIKFLKGIGMHGIIYDKIDVYNTKEKKESVFLCEEREALEAMRKVASSSRENDGNSEDDNKYKAGTNSSFGSMFASEESSVNEGVCNLRQFGMIVQ